jgi:hypothetical protein
MVMMVPVVVLAVMGRTFVAAPFEIAVTARIVGGDPAVRAQAGRAAGGMLAEAVMPAAMIPAVTHQAMVVMMTHQAVVVMMAMRGCAGAAERDGKQ